VTATPPIILLTRPEPQSAELASRLRARIGPEVPILVSPILEIVPRAFELPVTPRFLVLTSAHASDAAARAGLPAGLTAYCVGDRTAEAARAAGFRAISAGGAARDLARLLSEARPAGPGLHLHGRHVTTTLQEQLNLAGIDTYSVVAYDQLSRPLSARARAALAGPAALILPVYSPRSSALLSAECAGAAAPIDVVAISGPAAEPWKGASAAVLVAASPDGAAMEEAIVRRAVARSAC
jgi:uroporphyrinogen-III synthase